MINRFGLLLLLTPALGFFGACTTGNTSGTPAADAGDPGDGATTDGPTDSGGGGTQCTKARDDLLLPVDKVSTGAVGIVSESGTTKTIYVDATAGGLGNSVKSPRVYVNLESGTRVDLTDKAAPAVATWDLALKRAVIFTNSGDAGVGAGGAIQLAKSFASVSDAEAKAAMLERERFFDEDCNAQLDPTNAPATTFSDWYDYDMATMVPSPKNATFVVRGAAGKKYKVGIKSYQGAADGGTGQATGFYVLQVTAL